MATLGRLLTVLVIVGIAVGGLCLSDLGHRSVDPCLSFVAILAGSPPVHSLALAGSVVPARTEGLTLSLLDRLVPPPRA